MPPPRRTPGFFFLAACAALVLASARLFYGAMLEQTGGEWSAPLDDVFIHFDYARATARGYPFQWSEGNGYSSGNTSLTYPFVLAVGYWLRFRGPSLMVWAALVAEVSVFVFLWSSTRVFRELPRPTWILGPLAVLAVGALQWSLWSGMEVALFLGLFGGALVLATKVGEGELAPERGALGLGALGVLLVTTRPEAATTIACLGAFAAFFAARRLGLGAGLSVLARAGLPAALTLVAQAVTNRALTGEWSAAGALVKIGALHPYMTREEKLADWRHNVEYCIDRLVRHHFGDEPADPQLFASHPSVAFYLTRGLLPVVLALLPLFDRRTRRFALLLLACAASWTLFVAMNGQVRWQNERYLMPAVAWLLLSAGLGLAALVARRTVAGVFVGTLLAVTFARHSLAVLLPQFRDQVWFFARASRNIRDQHTTAGHLIRQLDPPAHRVLVGDAGAIVYAADLPGFDLIGLGGYKELPLARASVEGIAATLELIERLPDAERPDVMAIFPGWWPDLPGWFGRAIASVPVPGNVISGGAEKLVLRSDWRLLGTGAAPRSLVDGERVVDEVDVCDLVSEKAHGYAYPRPHGGFAEMRVLPDPKRPELDLWDGGRRIPFARPERFDVRGARPGDRLVFRTTVERPLVVHLRVGAHARSLVATPTPGWVELSVPVEDEGTLEVEVTPHRGDWVDHHVWLVGRR